MLKQPKPMYHLQVLFPQTTKDKKDTTPKTEYGLVNKLHKKTHRFQK